LGVAGSLGQAGNGGSGGSSAGNGGGLGLAGSGGAIENNGGMSAGGGVSAGSGGVSAGGTAGSSGFSICSGKPTSGSRVVSIYVIGDSTASIYASTLYPRTGWGQVLGDSFSSQCAVVKDKALSGRSSKSFYDEGAWTPIKAALVAGDFVVIQFGHNDEKSDDATLYTDPETTYKQYLTTYVNDARSKLAIPVLATSINRNEWTGTKLDDTHGGYPPAMRELAVSLGVPLVDLTALTKQYFEQIGQAATTQLFMDLAVGEFPNYPAGNTDNTHLRESGARAIAKLFTTNAYAQHLAIATSLNAVPTAP
jgi:lysophospholipase L1-like esterase